MDDLDFTAPPAKSSYDAQAALALFKSAGSTESVAAGKAVFAENEKSNRLLMRRDKMYYLLEGEVELSVGGKTVGAVRPGEIFGEMAVITQTSRTATATAKTACQLIAMDDKQLQAALRKIPEFALMLMGILISRLREIKARLSMDETLSGAPSRDGRVFDKKLLDALLGELGDNARMRYPQGKTIMQEGQAGVLMFVVLQGRVAISVQNFVVERVGPGGMFGEMALIERAQRMASAVAESDCELLAISRNVFLDLVQSSPDFAMSLLGAVGDRVRAVASRRAGGA